MTVINSSLFGECKVIETVKAYFPKKIRRWPLQITIAKPLNPAKGDGYWVTWGEGGYWKTGNMCMDKTIEFARQRANEYLEKGYGDEIRA